MEIKYRLTEVDLVEFTLHASWQPDNVKGVRMVAFIITVPLAIIVWLVTKPYITIWWMQSVLLVSLFAVGTLLLPLLYKRWLINQTIKSSKTNPEYNTDVVLTLTNDTIVSQTEFSKDERLWKSIDRMDDITNHLVIYTSSKTAYLIPKRAFENAVAMNLFKNMVAKHLPAKPNTDLNEHLIV